MYRAAANAKAVWRRSPSEMNIWLRIKGSGGQQQRDGCRQRNSAIRNRYATRTSAGQCRLLWERARASPSPPPQVQCNPSLINAIMLTMCAIMNCNVLLKSLQNSLYYLKCIESPSSFQAAPLVFWQNYRVVSPKMIHPECLYLQDKNIFFLNARVFYLIVKSRGAFDSAKNHKRQRRKRQSVTAKREKSQTPNFV